jgi:transposase
VQTEQMTARQAAAHLAVSRKTYHKWEKRILEVVQKAICPGKPGRPRQPRDPAKEALEQRVRELEEQVQVLEQSRQIRQALDAPEKKNYRARQAVNAIVEIHQQIRWRSLRPVRSA